MLTSRANEVEKNLKMKISEFLEYFFHVTPIFALLVLPESARNELTTGN
jgi:hypothetical protein